MKAARSPRQGAGEKRLRASGDAVGARRGAPIGAAKPRDRARSTGALHMRSVAEHARGIVTRMGRDAKGGSVSGASRARSRKGRADQHIRVLLILSRKIG
jgi:hypothetical protein